MIKICKTKDLVKDSGVCVLIEDKQIALFYIDNKVYAIDNYDPIGKAFVLARGIIGDSKGKLTVASPLNKEHYCLNSGKCLEHDEVSIAIHNCKIDGDFVFLA